MRAVATVLEGANGAWALTGAGMSTESGLPDYRGPRGLWKQRRFEELASLHALEHEPQAFWEFYRERLDHLGSARPNSGHVALARLEQAGVVRQVVTQNVDGLHQMAGSQDVIEFHGTLQLARCRSCGAQYEIAEARARWSVAADSVPRCDCGLVLGPGVVLFGEALPLCVERAYELAGSCDVALAFGTSLEVFPAAHLPLMTVERGGRLVIVNRGATQFDSLATVHVDAFLGDVLPRVAEMLLGPAEHDSGFEPE